METGDEKQLHDKLKLSKDVYLGDMDNLLQTVESQMPIIGDEQIYKWEVDKQEKIYLAFTIIGLLMLILGVLI